jgi:hypothetical protein
MHQVSRRALLVRAGIGGVGIGGLLAGGAVPALAAPGEGDLANARLLCSSKRLTINWYTGWINAPKLVGGESNRELLLDIRRQEQAHYNALAPLLGATAPVDDDFEFTFPGGATKTTKAATRFSLDLENLMVGIAVAAAATTADRDLAAQLAGIAAADGAHAGALSALGGDSPVPTDLPRPIWVEDASNQLAQFLSN